MKKILSFVLCFIMLLGFSLNAVASESDSAVNATFYRVPGSEISFGMLENDKLFSQQKLTMFSVAQTAFGLQGNLKINSGIGGKIYKIQFDIPSGNYLTLPSGENRDGSLLIVDKEGNLTGAVDPLKIIDQNGTEIQVDVHIENNIVTYALSNADNLVYPLEGCISVYADAHSFSTWFRNGWWEMRGNYKTLSLVPTDGWHSFDATTAQISWSWGTVKAKFSGHAWWTNETGLNDQYYCHVMGSSKITDNEWNLEPERPSVGTYETIKANCNP